MTIRHLCKEALIRHTMTYQPGQCVTNRTGIPIHRPEDTDFQIRKPTLTAAASCRYLTTHALLEHLTNGHLHAIDNYLALQLKILYETYESYEEAQKFHALVKLHRKVTKLLRNQHEREAEIVPDGVIYHYARPTGQQPMP